MAKIDDLWPKIWSPKHHEQSLEDLVESQTLCVHRHNIEPPLGPIKPTLVIREKPWEARERRSQTCSSEAKRKSHTRSYHVTPQTSPLAKKSRFSITLKNSTLDTPITTPKGVPNLPGHNFDALDRHVGRKLSKVMPC